MSQNLPNMLDKTIEKIREMVDVNSVIGEPIVASEGITIIPISKVSVGFGCGGSDFPSASPKEMFGGGTGGGVTIQPVAFLILKGDSVRMIQIADKNSVAERVANMVPDAIDTFSSLINKKKNADIVTVETAEPAIIEPAEEAPVQE